MAKSDYPQQKTEHAHLVWEAHQFIKRLDFPIELDRLSDEALREIATVLSKHVKSLDILDREEEEDALEHE